MVETKSSQIRRNQEENRAEPSNNRRNPLPRDPFVGPQNRPSLEQENRNPEAVFMTPEKISDLVARAVQRSMEKRPVAEPSRDVSHPETVKERPRERVPREGQRERRMDGSPKREEESRPAPFPGQKRAHEELSELVADLQRELREVRRNMGQVPTKTKGVPYAENIVNEDLPTSFRPVTFEYDGTTDPWEHVCRFKNTAMVYRYSDGVKCRVFTTTLTKLAQTWFSQLEDGII